MIGVLSTETEALAVIEFFELFKTPWEFWRAGRNYDVVITSFAEIPDDLGARAVVSYSSEALVADVVAGARNDKRSSGDWVEWPGGHFPLYGNARVFEWSGQPVLKLRNGTGVIAMRLPRGNCPTVRIGFDLFYEVGFLLREGQPRDNAQCPTLDMHIALLRDVLVDLGVSFVEVLPVPPGYDFMVCLTHDVDFVGLRDHCFDHTMWGFLYRCFVVSLLDALRGRLSWPKCLRNWIAGVSLPLVLMRVLDDFWLEFDRYEQLERGLGSTFFFIPFRNVAGTSDSGPAPSRRAAKYDVLRIKNEIKNLVHNGFEVGVHGIDAWHDVAKARAELARIQELSGESEVGIRMHWLYWGTGAAKVIEDVGFDYDSTCGFNDAVGFRAGTTQAFRHLSTARLLELPLNIQDSALFYRDRMKLSERDALEACKILIQATLFQGGVLTINWHTRSLSPERLWGDFYKKLLSELKAHRVWFGKARHIVDWFRQRRGLAFDSVKFGETGVNLVLRASGKYSDSEFTVRVYHPPSSGFGRSASTHTDIQWKGQEKLFIGYPT